MVVLKFGGASTHTSAGIHNVIEIIRRQSVGSLLVVVSAIGKTTRNIEHCAHEAARGNAAGAYSQLDSVLALHTQLSSEVFPPELHETVGQRLHDLGASLRALLKGLSIVKELTPRSLDACCVYGEKFASAIIVEALHAVHIPVQYVPAETIVITDDTFGRAAVKEDAIRSNVQSRILPAIQEGKIILTEGYIGATHDGTPTTMGKESSDYTASLLGALCGADDIQIWTDVNGMMTADPRIVPEAKTIQELSYDEAEELAALGAKILHPLTIAPARNNGIPIHIKNSANMENAGTVIHAVPHEGTSVKAEAVALLGLARIDDTAGKEGQSQFLLRTPGGTAQFADAVNCADDKCNYSAVSIVGEGVGSDATLLLHATAALAPMDVRSVLYGASRNSISVIVDAAQGERALQALHKEFLSS